MNGPDCHTLSRNDEVSNATVSKIAAKALQKQRELLKPPPKFTVTYVRIKQWLLYFGASPPTQ
jgi:hypothetical protein